MSSEHILFIEDDNSGREMGVYNLEKAGYCVDGASNGADGLKIFDPSKHDLVITDVRMPGLSGIQVMEEIKKRSPEMPVLVITAYANVDSAVIAMKAGAFDFIGKPFNRDHLLLTVKKAIEASHLKRELRDLKGQIGGVERTIIHRSKLMAKALRLVDRVAVTDASVLVTGESGTGKELIARRVHTRSMRAKGPFVAVNVAAMPSELLESEMFGHEKGAFTGAIRKREGHFKQANGGTIFLDEIGDIPMSLQGKLLRVLQEKTVDSLGSDDPFNIDVRIVAATNRDLKKEAAEGRFREDLFYRINVMEIEVPPLRDRPEDIEPLAQHFFTLYAQGRRLHVPKEVMAELESRRWRGNVRELENACRRLAILADDDTLSLDAMSSSSDALDAEIGDGNLEWPKLPKEGLSLFDLEKRVIERVLNLKSGNVTQAALYLKIPRHVLAYRMEKYGIQKGK